MSSTPVVLDPEDIETEPSQRAPASSAPVTLDDGDFATDPAQIAAANREFAKGTFHLDANAPAPGVGLLPNAPSLGAPPVRSPSVDEQQINRFMPNPDRFVTQQPQTMGQLQKQIQDGTPIAEVPGERVHPSAPAPAPNIDMHGVSVLPAGGVPSEAEPGMQFNQNQQAARSALAYASGIPQLVGGIKDIARSGATQGQIGGYIPGTATSKLQRTNPDLAAKGAAEVIGGLGTPAMVAGAPEALAVAPMKMLAGLAAGTVTSAAAGGTAKMLGFGQGVEDLSATLGFFLPSIGAMASGLRTGDFNNPARNVTGKGFSVFGGRVQGAAGSSPTEFRAGVRIGGNTFSVGVARNPIAVHAAEETDAAINALVTRSRVEEAAARVVSSGETPQQAIQDVTPKAPEPPKPAGMDQGELKPVVVSDLARAITLAPADQRGALVMEAHANLSKWIQSQGKILGPDGQIRIAKTPEQADQLAAKLVNAEVARQQAQANSTGAAAVAPEVSRPAPTSQPKPRRIRRAASIEVQPSPPQEQPAQPATTPALEATSTPAPSVTSQPIATRMPEQEPVAQPPGITPEREPVREPEPTSDQAAATPEQVPETGAQEADRGGTPLPAELAGSKPRYGYRNKNFQLEFSDPRDLAAFTVGQKTKNKAHDRFMSYLRGQFPDDAAILTHTQKVRNYIKDVARDADPGAGPIRVPSLMGAAEAGDATREGTRPTEKEAAAPETAAPGTHEIANTEPKAKASPKNVKPGHILIATQDGLREVAAEPVKFKGFSGFQFAVHQDPGTETFSVTEVSSGRRLGQGTSRASAVQSARDALRGITPDVFRRTVSKHRAELAEKQREAGYADVQPLWERSGTRTSAPAEAPPYPRGQSDAGIVAENYSRKPAQDGEELSHGPGGTVLRSSLFGADLAAEAAAKIAVHEWNIEVLPFLKKAAVGTRAAMNELRGMFAPRSLADPAALDTVMTAMGEREKHAFYLEKVLEGAKNMFDKLGRDRQTDFIDRFKSGQPQVTPELEEVANLMRRVDEDTYRAIVGVQAAAMRPAIAEAWDKLSAKEKDDFFLRHEASIEQPDNDLQALSDAALDWRENHFRVLWKEVPGKPEAKRGKPHADRGPLQGTEGFTHQATLSDMSEGLQKGGVPWSYNPVSLFKMAQADAYRYLTALKIWRDALDDGGRVFVKRGKPLPDGFQYVEDRIGDVRFRAASGEGMIEAGKWALRNDYALLLNNFLSADWIRKFTLGRLAMDAKNHLTAFRLSFSPFHAFTTTISSIASQIGLGYAQVGRGLRTLDMDALKSGAANLATALVAPRRTWKIGKMASVYVSNPKMFIASSKGQDFLKQYPGLDKMIDAAFTGGAKLTMNRDERVRSWEAFKQAIAEKKAIAALALSPLAFNQFLMTPLFEWYIPRLKFGMFIREFSEALADKADELGAGGVTAATLARQRWDSVEDVFGQMNWDKYFWHNTLRSAVQLFFRAFAWHLGQMSVMGKGVSGQAREFAESLAYLWKQFHPDSEWGPKYSGTTAVPRLHPDFAKILGLMTIQVFLAAVVEEIYTHEHPKTPADLVAPRIGGVDSHGMPRRITLPVVMVKDLIALQYNGFGGYISSGESDLVSGISDVLRNDDFRHVMVHNPDDPWWQQRWDDAKHVIGEPVGISSALRGGEGGQPTRERILRGVGFGSAPFEMGLSRAEKKMLEMNKAGWTTVTQKEIDESRERHQAILRSHTRLGWRERQEARKPFLLREFDRLSYLQAKNIYENYATPAEQRILHPDLVKKRINALRNHRTPQGWRQ